MKFVCEHRRPGDLQPRSCEDCAHKEIDLLQKLLCTILSATYGLKTEISTDLLEESNGREVMYGWLPNGNVFIQVVSK